MRPGHQLESNEIKTTPTLYLQTLNRRVVTLPWKSPPFISFSSGEYLATQSSRLRVFLGLLKIIERLPLCSATPTIQSAREWKKWTIPVYNPHHQGQGTSKCVPRLNNHLDLMQLIWLTPSTSHPPVVSNGDWKLSLVSGPDAVQGVRKSTFDMKQCLVLVPESLGN